MTQPQPPHRAPSPPPVTQKRRGRLPKTVVVQPTVPPSPVSYAFGSRTSLPSNDATTAHAAATPERPLIFVPQFLRAHSPAYEGGGNDVPDVPATTTTTIDALKGKQNKKQNENHAKAEETEKAQQ
jgi:hypothetical protein